MSIFSLDSKIISYTKIDGKYGYFDCLVQKGETSWKATIYPAEFMLRMFAQVNVEKILDEKMLKELDGLISDYAAERERWNNFKD